MMNFKNKKNIKICHLTSVHSVFDTRIFHKECKSLAQAGYNVTFIVPANKFRATVVEDENVQVVAVPKASSRQERIIKTLRYVYRAARKVDADIYHFHDPELIPIGLLLRYQGKHVIYDIHEDYPRSFLSSGRDYIPPSMRKLASWFFEHFENWTASRLSALITATPAIGKRFLSVHPNTIVVNNYPILNELKVENKTTWGERPFDVAYIGTISIERGLEQMIEAVGLLPVDLGVRLKIAGNFPTIIDQDALSQMSGWQQVNVLGFVPRDKLSRLLGKVCAGLVLFHPVPNHVEAQPNKLFEYMAAGIPVVASDFPLWREIVEGAGCGLLVDPLEPKAIAEAIEYILTHPQEAEAMGRRGQDAVEKFYHWEAEAVKLVRLYADLLRD